MRARVYPGLVDRHRMSPAEADRELLHMGAVLQTLAACVQLVECLEQAQRVPSGPEGFQASLPDGHELKGGHIELSDGLAKQIAAQLRGGEG